MIIELKGFSSWKGSSSSFVFLRGGKKKKRETSTISSYIFSFETSLEKFRVWRYFDLGGKPIVAVIDVQNASFEFHAVHQHSVWNFCRDEYKLATTRCPKMGTDTCLGVDIPGDDIFTSEFPWRMPLDLLIFTKIQVSEYRDLNCKLVN